MHTCVAAQTARELLLLRVMHPSKRFVDEVVELSRDCEMGQEGDRAVVTALAGHYMTLTFPDRGPGLRDVHTGADYKHLRAYSGPIELSGSDLRLYHPPGQHAQTQALPMDRITTDRNATLRELRALVATYLEGSADAPRAAELLNVLEVPTRVPAFTPQFPFLPPLMLEKRERELFGCTAATIDMAIGHQAPRDVAMYAMGTLSNAQALIQRDEYEGKIAWTVADRDANTIRQLINIAKYAVDKAVSR